VKRTVEKSRCLALIAPSTCLAAGAGVVEQMAGPQRSFRNSLPVAHTTFTSTVGSRFNGSCARGSFNVSSSLACLCSLETESLSSALYRATCGSVT
jgi:hypothetical protein